MNIPTPDPISSLETMSVEAQSTFFHEYIHFLQDVTSLYGIGNMYNTFNYMLYAVNVIKTRGSILPLPITLDADDIIHSQGFLQKLYLGSGIKDANTYDNYKIYKCYRRPAKHVTSEGRVIMPCQVIVEYDNGSCFEFGSFWLCESMAYMAEKYIYPDCKKPNSLPYFAASDIANFIYPSLQQNNSLNLLALCDACLRFFNPAEVFHLNLERMASMKWLPKDPRDIYDFVERSIKLNFQGATNLNDAHEISIKPALEAIRDVLNNELLDVTYEWIKLIIERGYQLRLSNASFIIDLVKGGPLTANVKFAETLRMLGSPLMSSNSGERSIIHLLGFKDSHDKDFDPNIFQVLRSFLLLFSNGEVGCSMKFYCKESAHTQGVADFTNDKCHTKPWSRLNDKELCSYGMISKSWGLQGVI